MFHVLAVALAGLPDPPPSAPAGLADKANTVLGLIKWVSLMSALAVLMGAGGLLFAAERGHGGGLSDRMKSTLGSVLVALVVVGAASAIVSFLSCPG